MKIDIEDLKQIMYGKIDWVKVFKDAHASRKGAWYELGHIMEWRNATDEVLFAVWHQLEDEIKKFAEVSEDVSTVDVKDMKFYKKGEKLAKDGKEKEQSEPDKDRTIGVTKE